MSHVFACVVSHIQEVATLQGFQSIDTVQYGNGQLSSALWCASPVGEEHQWLEGERRIGFLQAVGARRDQSFPCQDVSESEK